MRSENEKILELKKLIKQVVKDVESGKLDKVRAAEQISLMREDIDKFIEHLRKHPMS
jgi:ribosomal protein S15P/S13E